MKWTHNGITYEQNDCNFGESCVDETNWRPTTELVRAAIATGQVTEQGSYDYPDGKDTGTEPFRRLGADITEIDEMINNITDTPKKEQEAAEKLSKQQDALAEAVKRGLEAAMNNEK